MADALDTIIALTPFVAFCAFVLIISGLIAPRTEHKEPGE
jgi:hypothetical protein